MATVPSNSKPTILLVQGSFQEPQAYEKLANALRSRGFLVVQPTLPSLTGHKDADFDDRNLDTDSAAVETEAKRLVTDEGKEVMVVMHSYGGLVGSNAIAEDLSLQSRRERGLPGGVFRLFYFVAFILGQGQSVIGAFGPGKKSPRKENGRFTMEDPRENMYHDLPPDEANAWAGIIVDQSWAVQETPITRIAYKHIPSTYVMTTDDRAVPLEYQEMFAAVAGAEVKKIHSSHSPQLSRPDELADLIVEAAGIRG